MWFEDAEALCECVWDCALEWSVCGELVLARDGDAGGEDPQMSSPFS